MKSSRFSFDPRAAPHTAWIALNFTALLSPGWQSFYNTPTPAGKLNFEIEQCLIFVLETALYDEVSHERAMGWPAERGDVFMIVISGHALFEISLRLFSVACGTNWIIKCEKICYDRDAIPQIRGHIYFCRRYFFIFMVHIALVFLLQNT